MKNRIVLASKILLSSLLIVSCSTNDSSSCEQALTGALSTEESGLVGNWILTNMVSEDPVDITTDGVDNSSTDIFGQLDDCDKDVEYIFENDRNFTLKQQFTAENCPNKSSLNGTWKYANDILSLVSACNLQTITILVDGGFTTFSFEGLYTFLEVDGTVTSSNVTLTYTKS